MTKLKNMMPDEIHKKSLEKASKTPFQCSLCRSVMYSFDFKRGVYNLEFNTTLNGYCSTRENAIWFNNCYDCKKMYNTYKTLQNLKKKYEETINVHNNKVEKALKCLNGKFDKYNVIILDKSVICLAEKELSYNELKEENDKLKEENNKLKNKKF